MRGPARCATRLEALNLAGARLATRVVVLNTALEPLHGRRRSSPRFASALQPALTSLTNTARTVALAVVSRRPAHLATVEVRAAPAHEAAARAAGAHRRRRAIPRAAQQLQEILRQIEQLLPEIDDALRATIDRAEERSAFSLELLDMRDVDAAAAGLDLEFHPSRRSRAGAFHRAARGLHDCSAWSIFKAYALPHGYWLPFTIVVVLQPDYGSTRQRAAQRVLGTFAGSAVASALLWLHMPFAAIASGHGRHDFRLRLFRETKLRASRFSSSRCSSCCSRRRSIP